MEINQRADDALRANVKDNMRVVGHEVAREVRPNPDDARDGRMADQAVTRNKNQIRDVVDLSVNKPTPTEKRDSDFKQSNVRSREEKVEDHKREVDRDVQVREKRTEQISENREEKFERVEDRREDYRKEQEVKDRREREDNSRRNLDLLA